MPETWQESNGFQADNLRHFIGCLSEVILRCQYTQYWDDSENGNIPNFGILNVPVFGMQNLSMNLPLNEIERSGNYDAAMAEITGFNSSQQLKAAASQYKSNANAAAAAGILDTVSTGAKGYNQYTNSKKAPDQAAINTAPPPKTTGGWK